jgi:type VI protein secretion system component VasF
VTVNWASPWHDRLASTVQQRRERDRPAARNGQHPLKSDPGPRLKNDWVSALLVALQLVMLVLLLTGQIR